jgi:hypothetical protein
MSFRSRLKINEEPGWFSFFFWSILTFGIYAIVILSRISVDINRLASPYDRRKTMHFCLLFFLVDPLTLGIAGLVWYTHLCQRIHSELVRRKIRYSFYACDFWFWNILGSLIVVGPFIFCHKLFKAMNLLGDDYNKNL